MIATVPDDVRARFGASGDVRVLCAESSTFQVGDLVVKKLDDGSLENDRSLELAAWLGTVLPAVDENGFRLAQPVRASDGRWILDDGWAAWRYVAGRPANAADVVTVIPAVRALHRSLSHVPNHPALNDNTTAWGIAHRHCWGTRPPWIHPIIAPLADELYARLRPLPPSRSQLVHGDLNADNILIAEGCPPAFIDFTPFWAPAEFALAMFANWIGPRAGDAAVLAHFEHEPQFPQLLLRASIRMLLIVSELRGVEDWHTERRAAELVISYVDSRWPENGMTAKVTHDGERWSNAADDQIELSPSDASWPARFTAEAAAIRAALGDRFAYDVHHIGSTAVPGLAAKPIIDIVLEVADREVWPSLVEPLHRLGYVYWAENPDATKMFFVKGMPPFGTGRTHHIHVHTPDAVEPVLRFRDYLTAHPEEARRYEELKRELAAKFQLDRDRYTKAKESFVREVLRGARASG